MNRKIISLSCISSELSPTPWFPLTAHSHVLHRAGDQGTGFSSDLSNSLTHTASLDLSPPIFEIKRTDSIFLKIQLSSNSFRLTVLHTFMLSSHCPLWVSHPFPRSCYIYFSLFHFPPQHALFSFSYFLKAWFPCLHFLPPHSQHTHTHRIQTSLWEPKDYNKLVVITGLHGRNKSFPLCFAVNPPRETTPKQNKEVLH